MLIGHTIVRTERCDDSMKWARENYPYLQHGTLFIPNTLTHARGRQNRTWILEKGQITITCILKPTLQSPLNDITLNALNMALAVGIVTPFIPYKAQLKWPNDFVFNTMKFGGMLIESIWQQKKLDALILGFSLNINNQFTQSHLLYGTATSVSDQIKKQLPIDLIQNNILATLNEYYTLWLNEKFMTIYDAWKHLQYYQLHTISIHDVHNTIISGRVKNYLPTGEIVITCQSSNKDLIIPLHHINTLL